MSSLTFSYNPDETNHILSKLNLSSDFLKTPPRETRGRDLEREQRRQINLELHCATLTEYLRVKRIPRGLRVPLRPTLFSDCPEFCQKYEQILNKCSFDLMTLTVEHLQGAIASSKETIKNIETQLSSAGTAEELDNLKTRIKTVTDQHRRDTENRKRIKFQRDLDDYENNRVYHWLDRSTFRPNTNRSDYHSSNDPSTSGSDTDRRDNFGGPSNFLGQRKRRQQPRRRGPAGANEKRETDSYRVTRSQSRLY
ncbi:uncharacterized protein [Ranitomeya imitator]|uniref:uncharacterized protein n=1 Tax=Ranitomeya imitator TaxID=111125 RepID=UPI0037E73A79